MTKAARIDSITETAEQQINIIVTKGDAPLPTGSSGEGVLYSSRADLMAAIAEAEVRIANDLHMIQLGKALKADPLMGSVFRAGAIGKTALLDLTGSQITLSVI